MQLYSGSRIGRRSPEAEKNTEMIWRKIKCLKMLGWQWDFS